MSKTVLITGASSGFGLQLAIDLYQKGYTVIGTSRHPENYDTQFPFRMMRLDLDDDHAIARFADELSASIPHLDVLVNNAGFLVTGIAEETPIELGKRQFETNFWGTVKVTNALLPLFRRQRSGHIVTISSIVGLIGPPNLSYYSASKHAVEGYFKSLRFELHRFNIKVSMVEPRWFKTNIGVNAVSSQHPIADYDGYREQLAAFTDDGIQNAEDPALVTDMVHKIIETKEPSFKNLAGKMAGVIVFLQNYAPKMFEKTMLADVQKAK
jgi:NAD(P)-dependent dehydrogenase (short-subunit alcohol dehydrogenase family)